MLTSTVKVIIAYSEFAMWNAEDALVLTDKGAEETRVLQLVTN